MLYLIDGRNRAEYALQIEEMFRFRHSVYVEGRGWKAIARPDRREVDQFDTDEAIYLLGLASDGNRPKRGSPSSDNRAAPDAHVSLPHLRLGAASLAMSASSR